jgi:ABC-2 type transport system ATP-binding protein
MLALQGLSRLYGQTVALDGLSLEVPEGEVVGFVGPNGAGKTTAMRIALGVLEADAGASRQGGIGHGGLDRWGAFGFMRWGADRRVRTVSCYAAGWTGP